MNKLEQETKTVYIDDKIQKALAIAVKFNKPTMLIGETGTGKTTFIRELAKENGKELYRINLTGQTSTDDLIGKFLANEKGIYWIDGLLIKAMREGNWVVLDELNMALPEILSRLHSLLDDERRIILTENNGEVVSTHKDFRLFATQNPSTDYAGTKELNKAFLSRFPIIVYVNFTEHEKDLLIAKTEINEKLADKLVKFAGEIRMSKEKDVLNYVCSTRDLIQAGELIKQGLAQDEAIEIAIINKADPQEQEAIRKFYTLYFGTNIKLSKDIKLESITDIFEASKKLVKRIKDLEEEKQADREYYDKKYNDLMKDYAEYRDKH